MNEHIVWIGRPAAETLESIQVALNSGGYTLHIVDTQEAGLKAAQELLPAAVLVDVSTPGINGIQIISWLKSQEPHIRVVAYIENDPALRRAALLVDADLALEGVGELKTWLAALHLNSSSLTLVRSLLGEARVDMLGVTELLAHDLKSPISLIISSLEVLINLNDDYNFPDSTVRLLKGALHAAYRQMYMVADLIDLARLELGNYDLQLIELDLAQIVRDGLAQEAYALSVKGLNVKTDLPEQPLLIRADRELVKRVVSAILDSVVKFTIREDTLWVSAGQEGDEIVVRFSDTGRLIQPGYEQEILRRASHWEKRQEGTRTSVALALPFTYAVAHAHGGSFTAQSDPDKHLTTFTLKLPLVPPVGHLV